MLSKWAWHDMKHSWHRRKVARHDTADMFDTSTLSSSSYTSSDSSNNEEEGKEKVNQLVLNKKKRASGSCY